MKLDFDLAHLIITFNPMHYLKLRGRKDDVDIFSEDESDAVSTPTLTYEQFTKLTDWLKGKGKYITVELKTTEKPSNIKGY